MARCETCDFIGPDESPHQAAARETQRAVHRFVETMVGPLADWQARLLDQLFSGKVDATTLRVGRRC